MMYATEIVKSFVMRNPATGATCSPYGSIPPGYTERVDRGYSLAHSDGIVGNGRPPFTDRADAVALAKSINARAIEGLEQHARMYPQTAEDCARRIARIPLAFD